MYVQQGYWVVISFFCRIFVWFEYQDNADLIKCVWKRSSLFYFLGRVCKGLVLTFHWMFGRNHQSNHMVLGSCLLRVMRVTWPPLESIWGILWLNLLWGHPTASQNMESKAVTTATRIKWKGTHPPKMPGTEEAFCTDKYKPESAVTRGSLC